MAERAVIAEMENTRYVWHGTVGILARPVATIDFRWQSLLNIHELREGRMKWEFFYVTYYDISVVSMFGQRHFIKGAQLCGMSAIYQKKRNETDQNLSTTIK